MSGSSCGSVGRLDGGLSGVVCAVGGGGSFSTACLCFSVADEPVACSTRRDAQYVVHNKTAIARMITAATTPIANAGFESNRHWGNHCFHRDEVTAAASVI